MNVERTVRESLTSYPTLFETGGDVLYYLFCIIGNGHEWRNGEIVDEFSEERKPWTSEREWERFNQHYGENGSVIADLLRPKVEEEIVLLQKIVDEVGTRWSDMSVHRKTSSFYPQSHYALLMNVPEDVTDDWHEAAEWAKNLALENGWKF